MLKIGKFNWEKMGVRAIYEQQNVPMHPPTKHNKKLTDNITAYAHWVIAQLKSSADHIPDAGKEVWNACSICMNQKNVDFLGKCFLPMDWLNLSPRVNDSLADDEYGILEEEVIVPCR